MDRVNYQSMIIQDLVNDYKDKKLNLNPWYQRRSVWTKPQKACLINTLLERKPAACTVQSSARVQQIAHIMQIKCC